ncbi:exodeoxyribonuclease VII small subunit [Deinobacterium chartae]|uniref:Exodeoxyribonuclease VII small subunit n=1 Tax=Deinobacterium chartae TaxID=521158 RepID=A0A841I340_9DEIO|nr:exodeoxyribonuclease VII small subunit [Deinobacterium chartae]MBB6098830.1 exodeoxyribonuclease VII small subunit [Deinobacterium chartae]
MNRDFQTHYETLERIARQLEEEGADIDTLIPLLKEAAEAYEACRERLEAVRALLEE